MSEWIKCKLGDVVKTNVKSLDKSYSFEKILYLDTGSVTKGKIESFQEITLKDAPSRAKRLVKPNDIVYSTVRPIQRHYGLLKRPQPNLVVSTGFTVIEVNQKLANPEFIYYILSSDESVEYLDVIAEASTSTYPSLKPSDIENLDISLPTIEEQKAIASALSSLNDKIDLLDRQNTNLERMAETLFRQWFIEEAHEDWVLHKLGDCVTISYGKNLPTKNLLEDGFPVFGANGQIGFYDRYTYDKPQVLVSCRGEASGKVNISLPKSYVTNNSLILERNKMLDISFEFLKYWALSYDFDLHVSGSAQPQITIDGLYDADFTLPPKDLIEKFTEMVKGPESKKLNNFYQIKTLEKLRDNLLPKLMSGEVLVEFNGEHHDAI